MSKSHLMTELKSWGRKSATLAFTFCALASIHALQASDKTYDFIITGGKIVDGSGKAAYSADVGVKNGIIAKIGTLKTSKTDRLIDATGKIVSPGFIDLHSHSDDYEGEKEGLRSKDPARRQALNIITQGVTTVVVNPDGSGVPGLSIKNQRKQLQNGGTGPNVALMIPHNAVRYAVMREDHRRLASEQEIAAMQHLVKQGMEEGAFGLSSGLEYIPGRWSNVDEVASLMEVVAPYNGVHMSHMRSETTAPMWWVPSQDAANPPQLQDAVSEIIAIAERTKTRGVVTHMKIRGTTHWGQSVDVIKLIEDAQARGVDMYGDQYPYATSGSDGRIVFIPDWVYGTEDTLEEIINSSDKKIDLQAKLRGVLANKTQHAALVSDIKHALAFRGGAENVKIFDYPNRSLIGKNLQEVADARGTNVPDLIIALQLEGYADRRGGARLRSFSLHDDDMVRLMKKDWVATASDGGVALPEDGPAVHARYYGTFTRKIGHYSRDRNIIGLEKAVRSVTSLPATILGLKTRGLLAEGMVADITVFDYATIKDQATFTNPHQFSTGVDHVWVNGLAVLTDGKPTKALAGKVLDANID